MTAECPLPGRASAAERVLLEVGVGWAFARVGRPPAGLGGAMLDGYGFHQGYFHPARFAGRGFPAWGDAADRGLGRSLFFHHVGAAAPIAAAVGRFDAGRQEAMWTGLGVAAAFTGGLTREALYALREAASTHTAALYAGARAAPVLEAPAPPWTKLARDVLSQGGADEGEEHAAT